MRIEKDSLGQVELPETALYGPGTLRGAGNFNLVGQPLSAYPGFIRAAAKLKKAAARANHRVGALDGDVAEAIWRACDEIIDGRHHENFIVSLAEGSGGTSTNMNFNEVIANRAGQLLGEPLGAFGRVHPNDHVNKSQSTNDVIPSAIKLTCYVEAARLIEEGLALSEAFRRKAEEFGSMLRVGRTCMQAAQPMTYGQLFGGYASSVKRAVGALDGARRELATVPMGGTAIGTGLGAAAGYRDVIAEELSAVFGFPVNQPADWFDGMQAADGFTRFAGEMTILAECLSKIAGDLVILSSGSNSGIGEIILPSVQPGSSIMAGKVNPVMCMLMQQIAYMVQGDSTTVALAALNGQMEINHFEPVIARALFNSMESLVNGLRLFREKCVAGLSVDAERSYANLTGSAAMSSVFLSSLGYAKVTEIVKAAFARDATFTEAAMEAGLVSRESLRETLERAARGRSLE